MNGFYPVLNEVHDKAVKDLSLAECALFEHIWRKLIGWNQFEDEISISQLVKETSGSRATILRLLKKLELKRWIVVLRSVTDKVRDTNTISIPECPGIKMRLGWCQNDTTPGIDMTLGGGVKMIHTTDSLSTDNLTDKKKEEDLVVPTSDEEKELSETDQFIVLLKDKFKLPSDPAYGTVNHMVYTYGIESCIAAMENSDPKGRTWGGILAYLGKVAATLSAQSRGVSGEKLDKLEREYRELYYEVEESQAAVDRDRDGMDVKMLAEAESWLDRSESKLAMMRDTIEENGGSLEVRR